LKLALNKDRYSFGRDQTKSAGAGFDNSTGQNTGQHPSITTRSVTMILYVINYHFTIHFTILQPLVLWILSE
jgi:hypothetical protein